MLFERLSRQLTSVFNWSSTRQGYENLLRDLLTCLAKKYRIEEQCGSSQVKHEIWRQLTNEYLQVDFLVLSLSSLLFYSPFTHPKGQLLCLSTQRWKDTRANPMKHLLVEIPCNLGSILLRFYG